jgi:hypothetical protein
VVLLSLLVVVAELEKLQDPEELQDQEPEDLQDHELRLDQVQVEVVGVVAVELQDQGLRLDQVQVEVVGVVAVDDNNLQLSNNLQHLQHSLQHLKLSNWQLLSNIR